MMQVGKMRADFGKQVNTIHNHALPLIDRTLATNNIVAAKTASTTRNSLSHFIAAPKAVHEGTAQV